MNIGDKFILKGELRVECCQARIPSGTEIVVEKVPSPQRLVIRHGHAFHVVKRSVLKKVVE